LEIERQENKRAYTKVKDYCMLYVEKKAFLRSFDDCKINMLEERSLEFKKDYLHKNFNLNILIILTECRKFQQNQN
jgi:hypothetical protein